jgi:hypothetical protein
MKNLTRYSEIFYFFPKNNNLKVNNYSANVLKLPLYCISCYGVVAKPFLDGKYSVIWLYIWHVYQCWPGICFC